MDDLYDYEREYYEEPDYDVWERAQIDRDRDAGEYAEFEPYFDGEDIGDDFGDSDD